MVFKKYQNARPDPMPPLDDFMNTGDKGARGQRNYKGDREKVGRRGPAKKGNWVPQGQNGN